MCWRKKEGKGKNTQLNKYRCLLILGTFWPKRVSCHYRSFAFEFDIARPSPYLMLILLILLCCAMRAFNFICCCFFLSNWHLLMTCGAAHNFRFICLQLVLFVRLNANQFFFLYHLPNASTTAIAIHFDGRQYWTKNNTISRLFFFFSFLSRCWLLPRR